MHDVTIDTRSYTEVSPVEEGRDSQTLRITYADRKRYVCETHNTLCDALDPEEKDHPGIWSLGYSYAVRRFGMVECSDAK